MQYLQILYALSRELTHPTNLEDLKSSKQALDKDSLAERLPETLLNYTILGLGFY